jgi:hypothetical protein
MMMSDSDLESKVRESVAGLHMQTPVETIMKTGQTRRHTRRAALSATAVACGAVIALIGVGVTSGSHQPSAARGTRLAAFTISTNSDGSPVLTLHKGAKYRLDPDEFRQALAEHGIPALLTVGKSCDSGPDVQGLDRVVNAHRQSNGEVYTTINAAAIPAGAELAIGYFPTHTTFRLLTQVAATRCP